MGKKKKIKKLYDVLENIDFLLHEVIPFMKANEDKVDFEFFEKETKCGTHRCLAGWYSHLRYGLIHVIWNSATSKPGEFVEREFKEFGIKDTGENWDLIFGEDSCGTLEDREARMLAHRATIERKLTKKMSEQSK